MHGAYHLLISTLLAVGGSAMAVNSPTQQYIGTSAVCSTPPDVLPNPAPLNAPPVEGIMLPLNHNGPPSEEFCNRYWVKDQFYKPGSPIFVYLAGESRANDSLWYINAGKKPADSDLSWFEMLLKNFNGMGIVLEHRYYGKSLPKNVIIGKKLDSDFQWHTTDLALEDVKKFAWSFSRPKYPKLTPKDTPWIAVGGSYPGIMAALLRQKFPETFFASYASSAPIQAAIEMPGYYDQVWYGMHAKYSDCAADLSAAVKWIDQRFVELENKTEERRKLKESLLGCDTNEVGNALFADWMASIYKRFQNYGVDEELLALCQHIQYDPETGRHSGPEGWAATKGADFVIRRLQSGTALQDAAKNFGKCKKTAQGLQLFRVEEANPDDISWTWQRCNEWGYFHVANVGPRQMVLSDKNVTYQQEYCNEYFKKAGSKGLMRSSPDAEGTNRKYGGWNARPSRVFWTAGQFDPWTVLSPFSANAKTKINGKPLGCSQDTSPRDMVFGYQLNNAEHCYDFGKYADKTKYTIALFTSALKGWLASCKKASFYSNYEL